MCGPASWKASVASSHRDSSSFFFGPLFLRTLTVACRRSRFPTLVFLPALRPGWNFWAIAFFEQRGLLFFFFGVTERRTATSDPLCALNSDGGDGFCRCKCLRSLQVQCSPSSFSGSKSGLPPRTHPDISQAGSSNHTQRSTVNICAPKKPHLGVPIQKDKSMAIRLCN